MIRRVIAIIIIMLSSVVMMYPRAVTEYNRYVFQEKNTEYVDKVSTITSEELRTNIEEMVSYNERIRREAHELIYESSDPFVSIESGKKELSFIGDKDVFAYMIIPKLNETLPIYLGATEEHLFDGVAHMAGTSLPIGGVSTHSVIAGHRGYYKALLFRHIDKLEKGDRFYIYVYGKKLSYVVDNIKIISPTELDTLKVIEGKDLVSLLSCHPFPYMSHRIIVQGERIQDDNYTLEEDYEWENIEYKTNLNSVEVEKIWNELIPETSYRTIEENIIEEKQTVQREEKVNLNEELPEIKRMRTLNYFIIFSCVAILLVMTILLIREIRK